MRLTQTLKQKPTVSPQLVLANRLLQFSSLELEQAIARELAENPALEFHPVQTCPRCGLDMEQGVCPACPSPDRQARREQETWRQENWSDAEDDAAWAWDEDGAGMGAGDSGYDPLAWVASSTTFAEHLLSQARLVLPAEDLLIARHLIGSLDDRGLLSCDLDLLASDLGLPRASLEAVLAVLQTLDPVGVAARDVRECLLIQLEHLRDGSAGDALALAEHLVLDCWHDLGRASLSRLARDVEASVEEVEEALRFIRENLNPFPAHTCWAHLRSARFEDGAGCPQPDVIIRESETAVEGYDIELPKAGSYGLRVSASYRRAMNDLSGENSPSSQRGWKRWEELCGRARLFVKSIEQRWETLHELMSCLVDYQRDFLVHGERRLRPLTRARVAEMMGVHESTVSRAVAGKYVELPCARVVPLEVFFDSAAPIKHLIEELVDQEDASLSDRAIAERLAEQGYDVARRTVAKYRDALDILPSSLRRRNRELGMPR